MWSHIFFRRVPRIIRSEKKTLIFFNEMEWTNKSKNKSRSFFCFAEMTEFAAFFFSISKKANDEMAIQSDRM